MVRDAQEIHIIPYRTYVLVWLALAVLLFISIAVARRHLLADYSVLATLFIASIKAGLILAFFMHLKYEGRFLKGMLITTLAALTITIALTFVDVWYR